MFIDKTNEPTIAKAAVEIGLEKLIIRNLTKDGERLPQYLKEASFFELSASDYSQVFCNLCNMPTSTLLVYPENTIKKLHFDETDLDPQRIDLVLFKTNIEFEIVIAHYCEFCQKFLEPFLNINTSTETLENFWQLLTIHLCPFCDQHHHTDLQKAMLGEGLQPLPNWPDAIIPTTIVQQMLPLT